jgi:phosphoserine phosphatase RsbU/P
MSNSPVRVLLIEDNPGDSRLIQVMLREAGEIDDAAQPLSVSVDPADRLSTALTRLTESTFDVVLTDLGLPDAEGLAVVLAIRDTAPEIPIVVLSGRDDRATALQAVHEGAQDFLVKGRVEAELLHRALRYAIERKRVEVERSHLLAREQQARAAAEAALRTRDQVLSTVTHDLRTPLAAISLYAQLLPERAQADDERLRYFLQEQAGKIREAAKDGLVMIDELLDVARLTMGEAIALERRPLDLAELVREIVVQQQEISTDHVLSFAEPERSIVGTWDGPRLRRVLNNLLSNATKYSPPGSEVSVQVATEDSDGGVWALTSVQDAGSGVPAEDLPRLFDWFWRGKNVTGRRGSGLGLAGARRIAELHGGTIMVESEEGVGSTFTVRLPLS